VSYGAAIQNINTDILRNTDIPLPALPIQRKIAAVLSAYDDLIENNNRRIAILEKMAEELYREWFVRMRFPGHEKVKIIKGMPEGWEAKRIGDVCVKVTDGAHASPGFVNDGKFMASVKDMTDFGFNTESMKTIGESDFIKLVQSDCKPLQDDVLIAKDGSYLKHVFVWNQNLDLVILSSIAILRPDKDIIQPYFFSLTLKQESIKSMMAAYVSGSALPRIILSDFKKMQLLVPERSLIIQFESIARLIYQNINIILDSISYLTASRDRLLSRLMSGKLDVEHLDIQFPVSMQEEAAANA
jgi:type I restriction enzyme S subunit